MANICVFCGSSNFVAEHYIQSAKEAASILAEQGHDLVYGGGNCGLMGAIANQMLSQKRKVYGYIPEKLISYEVAHHGITELVVTKNMHDRKWMMYEKSDAFVILPGGLGTLDEYFEILTWSQLGYHDKRIAIYNYKSFFQHLKDHIAFLKQENFYRERPEILFYDDFYQLVEELL